jgi:hypothetical protein
MCLSLENNKTRAKIAKEDIIVYKMLECDYKFNSDKIKHGDSFIGAINNTKCKGKISIGSDKRLFFCTNNRFLSGTDADDKLGYKYSWVMDRAVTKIIVNKEDICANKTPHYVTYFQEAEVEIGKTYTSKLIKEDEEVNEGLHSFGKLEDAKTFTSFVAKCIIPKGSRYYEGIFECSYLSYASNKITYLELIN